MPLATAFLVISLAVQLAAAAQAWRLVRFTGHRPAWLLISAALVLMAIRRVLSVAAVSAQGILISPAGPAIEGVSLVVSALLLLGVSLIGPFFRQASLDATAVERLREELVSRESQHRLLVNRLPLAVTVVLEDGIAFANRAFGEIFGVPPDQAVGRQLESFVAPSRSAELRAWMADRESVGTGSFGRSEWELSHPSGMPRWVAMRGALSSWDGKPALVVTAADVTAWKLASAQLEESEARFRALTEAAACAIIIVAEDRFRFLNAAAEELSGYSREQLLEVNAWDLVHPDFREMVRERALARLRGEAPPATYQFKLLHSSGAERWVDFTAGVVRYEGRPAIIGTAFDISEQKRSEEELRAHRAHLEELVRERTALLRESEETFRALAENSYDVIMRFDRRYRHLYANPIVEAQTGIPAAGFIGKTHAELGFPAGLVELWEASIERVFSTRQPSRVEFELPSHIWIDWLLIPEFSPDGEVRTVITTARDITDRKHVEEELRRHRDDLEGLVQERTVALKRANELLQNEIAERERIAHALRESEARFRGLYDNVTIGLYRTTPEGSILMANPALVRMLGFASFEALAGHNLELEAPYKDITRKHFRELVEATGEIAGLESTWVSEDGSLLHVRENAKVVRDASGKLLYYEGTVEDITEHRTLEDQLRQAQRLESLGHLAGGVAHDFNNILQAIQGSAELLKRRLAPAEALQREAEIVYRSVQRGAELTRGLLAFARRQVLEPTDLDLNNVVRDLLPMLRRVIPENIVIDFIPGYELGTVRADKGNLDQVVLNLCVNARDAMAAGGRISIETENVVVDGSYIATHPWAKEGRYVLLSLSDTGSGMDSFTLGHIFEPFFTTKAPGKGTGMGLATVYGIIKQHEGMIRPYSEPGKGTTFKIYLPVVARRAIEVGVRIEGPVVGGRETVLVAEDEVEVRHILVEVLSGLGYRVLEACDGVEALELLRREEGKVDLVVTDVVMPRMGGKELAAAARQVAPSALFLFSSGYTPNVVHDGFVKKDGVAFIAKPYSIDALGRKVREVLDRGLLGSDAGGAPEDPV